MSDWYDGPRAGVASYRGKPHVYESCWNDGEGADGSIYRLAPIDEATFRLALEDWRIWLRWEGAFHAGETPIETHPALPEERARHEQIKRLLGDALEIQGRPHELAMGEFEPAEPGIPATSCVGAMKVRWRPVSEPG